jgi:hypothetical protein
MHVRRSIARLFFGKRHYEAGKKLKFTFPVSGNSVHMYGMTELPQLIEASKQIEPGIRDSPETSYWPAPYPNMKFLPGFLDIVLLC